MPAGGWWHCFVYYMGVWVLMMFTFDYARFGRKEDAGYHGRFNFGMPFYLVTFSSTARPASISSARFRPGTPPKYPWCSRC